MEYENKILDAIEMIVDNKIQNANFDKTILATIVKNVNSALGQYVVKYQDSNFYAFSNDIDITYTKGTKVYVLIPNNDWSRQKTILGGVDQSNNEYTGTDIVSNIFEPIGNNCIVNQDEYQLCSYENTIEQILYEKDGQSNLLTLDITGLETYLKNAESINLSAEIKTNLPIEQRFRGNYGIGYEIAFYDNGTESEVIKTYVLDINQFESNPYKLFNYKKQNGIFDIDGQNFKYINKIYLFCTGFPNQETGHAADIFIRNIKIEGGRVLTSTELDSYGLKLIAPNGAYFDLNDTGSTVKTIQAYVRIKDKYINPETQSLSYYWFREDNSVVSSSEKYHTYGGQGWRCLNSYNVIQAATANNDAVVEWVPMGYTLTLSKADVAAKETQYKCVVTYNGNILSQITTIINFDSNYDISIESNDGTQFYYDIGNPNLTCKINGIEQTGSDYTYAWAKIDNYNNFFGLGETTSLNDDYADLVADYEDLLTDIAAEIAMPAASQAQLTAYENSLKEYENITRIDKNKIYHLLVKEITSFAFYKCSVFYQGTYIGTATIKILNNIGEEEQYTLVINNGTQTFKYNEAGIAPTSESLENPQAIPSLSFSLYDPNGEALEENVLNTCDISWNIPNENTFITHNYSNSIVENQLEIIYGIKENYNINYVNNDIELTVKYKNLILKTKTNLTFLKEGENGTNGTDFICKIVPNTNMQIDYPMILNGNLNYSPTETARWFKVQLWHDGNKIFDSSSSGMTLENKYATIQWSILKNKYTTLKSDPSHIIINADGEFSYTTNNEGGALADIVKASIIYNGIKYFTTIPVIVATATTPYGIELIKNSGFQYVFYNADGRYPQYNTSPFELKVTKIINEIKEDISIFTQNNSLTYTWSIQGTVYDPIEDSWVSQTLLEEIVDSSLNKNQKLFKPIDTYDGECLSTALYCSIADNNSNEVATIHIPIHLMLNRYGNAALNDWDGNSISIDKNGNGIILTPQIGAGIKEADNSFTGMFMGSVKEVGSNETEVGLFGYNKGVRTIELNAKDGSAKFGKTGAGQIIMDPSQDTAVLRSGNFEMILDNVASSDTYVENKVYYKKINNKYNRLIEGEDYEVGDTISYNNIYMWNGGDGLEIDLTEPHIIFGSGNFWVDTNGNITAKSGDIGGYHIGQNSLWNNVEEYATWVSASGIRYKYNANDIVGCATASISYDRMTPEEKAQFLAKYGFENEAAMYDKWDATLDGQIKINDVMKIATFVENSYASNISLNAGQSGSPANITLGGVKSTEAVKITSLGEIILKDDYAEGSIKTKSVTLNPTSGIALTGQDIHLGATPDTDDSGDIVFRYGDGSEKSRIWMDNILNSMNYLPNYRAFDSSGNQIGGGKLLTNNPIQIDSENILELEPGFYFKEGSSGWTENGWHQNTWHATLTVLGYGSGTGYGWRTLICFDNSSNELWIRNQQWDTWASWKKIG